MVISFVSLHWDDIRNKDISFQNIICLMFYETSAYHGKKNLMDKRKVKEKNRSLPVAWKQRGL